MEEERAKLKKLEKDLTLIRDDFRGYGKFMDRNIKQSKQMIEAQGSIIKALELLRLIPVTKGTQAANLAEAESLLRCAAKELR